MTKALHSVIDSRAYWNARVCLTAEAISELNYWCANARTHIDNESSVTGILLHPRWRGSLATGDEKPPVTERLIGYMCMLKPGLFIFAIEYFFIEEMRRYCIMGRGKKV